MTYPLLENSYPLTWSCMVCGEERPDQFISVHKKSITLGQVTVTMNIRYCNDRPKCLTGAMTKEFQNK
jgi:hypothetical protein